MVKMKSFLIILIALFSTHLTAQTIMDRDGDGLIDINYLENLDAIRNHLDGLPVACGENNDEACRGYELIRSLDFNDDTFYLDADANRARWTTGAGWEPIGDFSNPFNAIFMASTENLTISNLTIDRRNEPGVGLFGESFGRITDIHLSDVSVKGFSVVGGLVGSNRGQITASSVTGFVESVSAWAGGLVGTHWDEINNSYAQVDVSGYSSVGGLVGYSFGTITDSYAFGDVKARSFGGGLVGFNQAPIARSYASGSVESAFYGGGLIGYNDSYIDSISRGGVIENVYATGNVIGGTYLGGLVGYNDSDINNGYAIGRVIGGGGLGGLVGINDDEGVITNSYWDIDTTGQATSDGGTSRTTVQLQMPTASGATANMTYYQWRNSDWNFGSISDYPVLKDEDGNDLPLPELRLGTSFGLGALVLSGLRLSDGVLEPPFDPTKNRYELLDLADNQTTVTATTTLENVIISIEVDGRTASTGNQVVFTPFMDTVDNIVIRVTATGRSTATYTVVLPDDRPLLGGVPKAPCSLADIDQDDDRLIEICDIEGLYAMRYRLDGSAYKASSAAAELDRGCPDDGCIGYELMNELDFSNPDHYRDSSNQTIWMVADYSDDSDKGWRPIGDFAAPFNATFKANGYTISGLQINRDDSVNGRDRAGLFGHIGARAELNGIGLLDVDVRGRFSVGGLVGWNSSGTIINSSVEGDVVGSQVSNSWNSSWISGLVGTNDGAIVNSYAQASVSGHTTIGGLVGSALKGSDIRNSYAVGRVDGINYVGGLAGFNQGRFENCYANVAIEGIFSVAGLVALNDDEGVIENCYAVIDNVSFRTINGLVSDNQGVVIESYWQENDAISNNGVGEAQDLQQVSLFSEWSSADWDFTEGEYPGLKYTVGRNPDNPACETPPPDTELPNCGTLLAEQRFELEHIELVEARLVPDFDLATNDYVASVSAETTNVQIIVRANRKDTLIRINGNVVSVDAVNVVKLAETGNTQIEVVSVAEATTYTVVVRKITLPLCHASIEFPDDNDGIDQAIDIDKDNDGLIEICDLEGLDEIRYQLDGTGYRASADAEVIRVGCPDDGCEGYELTEDLNFTDNDSYRTIAKRVIWTADKARTNSGWPPIARFAFLTAIFEGNDYTIANLYININNGTTMGLFGFIQSEIRNVNLLNVDINGLAIVGGLVGLNGGLIINSRMTGRVSGASSNLGGLVGVNGNNAQINNSSANGTVTGTNDVGGLVGLNNGIIRNSFASGTVTGSNNIGGLSGLVSNDAIVINSHADSTVNGTETDNTGIGGLIGTSSGFIMGSHASGAVNVDAQGNDVNVGGLVGYNFCLIVNSYATGAIGGHSSIGGLVGLSEEDMSDGLTNVPIIINSYATGDATGTGNNNKNIGGLIGYNNRARVINTYAEGDVSGISNVGGLIGLLELGTIENSYTIGAVRGTGDDNRNIGGMVGATSGTVIITDSYWNRDTVGQATSAGGTSKTRVELRSPTAPGSTSTEVYYNWNPDYPSRADWDFGDSQTYPALRYAVGPDENNAACDDDPDTILPQCSLLLPDQPGRDRGLDFVFFLSDVDNAILELEPSLSPLIKQYKIVVSDNLEAIQLRPFAVNAGTATITIIKRGESPERNYLADMNSGDTSSAITLNDTTTTLVVTVTETVNGVELNSVYEFDILSASQRPDLVSLTVVEPANAELSMQNELEYLLRIADDITRVVLNATADNADTTISYSINNVDFNAVAGGDSLTIDPLPTEATAIIIRLESSDRNIRSVDYTIRIERVQRTRFLIQVRVFLEGALQETPP